MPSILTINTVKRKNTAFHIPEKTQSVPSEEFWGVCQSGKEDRLDASSSCCRFVQHTKNRQANSGCCLVKIHFTEGLPAVFCQEQPPHTYTQIPRQTKWNWLPLMTDAESPASLDTWDTLFTRKFYLNLVFRTQFQAICSLHGSPLGYTHFSSLHFIFHCQFNTSHTWKWLCVSEIASFHHSLFLLPLKEGDPLKESICGNSKI